MARWKTAWWLEKIVVKKVLESNWFKEKAIDVLNKLWWHQNISNLVLDATELSKVTTEKELNNRLNLKRDDIWDLGQDMVIATTEEIRD